MSAPHRPLTGNATPQEILLVTARGAEDLRGHLICGWVMVDRFKAVRDPDVLDYAAKHYQAAMGIAPAVEVAVAANAEIASLGQAIRDLRKGL